MYPFKTSDTYRNIPAVVYFRIDRRGIERRVNWQCFGGLSKKMLPCKVRYIAPINWVNFLGDQMTSEALSFYLDFMTKVISRPESPVFSFKVNKKSINFLLETKGLSYLRALFFLTWFRYVHHYPEVIRKLFSLHKPEHTLQDTFNNFFEIHNLFSNGRFPVSSRAGANEMVMYNWDNTREPIALEKLWINMEKSSKEPMRVQSHFL